MPDAARRMLCVLLIRPDWNEPIFPTLAAKDAARMGHPNAALSGRTNKPPIWDAG